jgi:hypothetical protein
MITERTAKLIGLLKRKEELDRYKKKREDFIHRRDALSEKVITLSPLVSCKEVLASYFHPSVQVKTLSESVADQTALLRTDFEQDAESILRQRNFRNEYLAGVQSLCNSLETDLASTWREYTAERLPEINPRVLQALSKIPAFDAVIKKLNDLITEVENLTGRLPIKQEHFELFNQKALEIESTWRELVSEGVPDEVLTFLQEVGTVFGARLSLLTEMVADWLRQQEIYEEFRVTIRRPDTA